MTFTGSIIDERLRGALKVIAENTPGCVAVHDHMAWIEPNSGVVIPSEGDDPKAIADKIAAQWDAITQKVGVEKQKVPAGTTTPYQPTNS